MKISVISLGLMAIIASKGINVNQTQLTTKVNNTNVVSTASWDNSSQYDSLISFDAHDLTSTSNDTNE
jgi:hypothetical protein